MHVVQTMVWIYQQWYSYILPVHFVIKSLSCVLF